MSTLPPAVTQALNDLQRASRYAGECQQSNARTRAEKVAAEERADAEKVLLTHLGSTQAVAALVASKEALCKYTFLDGPASAGSARAKALDLISSVLNPRTYEE